MLHELTQQIKDGAFHKGEGFICKCADTIITDWLKEKAEEISNRNDCGIDIKEHRFKVLYGILGLKEKTPEDEWKEKARELHGYIDEEVKKFWRGDGWKDPASPNR